MISNRNTHLCAFVLFSGLALNAASPAPQASTKAPEVKKTTPSVNKDLNTNIAIDNVINDGELVVRWVNEMEAMQASQQGKEVAKDLEAKRQKKTTEFMNKESAFKQAQADYKNKAATMTVQARNAEEARIVAMQDELAAMAKSFENELKLAMQQATEMLSIEVEKAVESIAKREGYDVVIGLYTGRTIYASPKAMITSDLVKAMDKTYVASKKPAAPAKSATATA
jgi:outer membrane protein